MTKARQVRRWKTQDPRNATERLALCGFNSSAAEAYWDKHADKHQTFFIAGQTEPPPETVRLWEMVVEVTGENPDISPQPTGNCVAAAVGESAELLQCSEIVRGEAHEFHKIYNPFHYATGRVLIMRDQLRGQAGASGGAVAEAVRVHGLVPIMPGLPDYNKANVDAWGDGRKAEGKSFRDFMEVGARNIIKATARVQSMGHVFEAIGSRYPLTIASNAGLSMKPDRDGYHRYVTRWNHQMSVWGYSRRYNWAAIKNQWGDVHGDIVDEDGCEWPPGLLRVHLDEFEARHFRGSETIVYSNLEGFPERIYDHRNLA